MSTQELLNESIKQYADKVWKEKPGKMSRERKPYEPIWDEIWRLSGIIIEGENK
jgi:hypothetical protein